MTTYDISEVLKEWPYDPERNVRRVRTPDGREWIQVRLPLGIEQYELDGRPDGRRPQRRESWLDYYLQRLKDLPESERRLDPTDCARLIDEGTLYYYRYLLLFQLGDYDRVIRDTTRNLRMADLIMKYAVEEDDKIRIGQYQPYIIRMRASAQAMKLAGENRVDEAKEIIEEAILEIESLPEIPSSTFAFERRRSLAVLRGMLGEMKHHRAPSEIEQLRLRLREAVEAEDYERAARIRDLLRRMERDGDSCEV